MIKNTNFLYFNKIVYKFIEKFRVKKEKIILKLIFVKIQIHFNIMINYLSILFLLLILIRFLVNFSFLEILLISECAPSSTCIRETNKIFKGNVKYLKNFFENYHNINLNKIKDNEFAQYIYVLERNNSNFSYKFKDLYSFVLPPMDEKPFNNVFGQNHGSPGDIVNLKKQRNNSFIIDSFSEFKTNENKIPLISYEMIEHYLLRYYNRELIFDMRFEKYAEKMISLNEKFVERIERYKYINLLSSEEKKDLLNRLTTETKKLDFNFERQSMLRILKDPRLISYPTIKPVFISADK